jgi:hypothetical protein
MIAKPTRGATRARFYFSSFLDITFSRFPEKTFG